MDYFFDSWLREQPVRSVGVRRAGRDDPGSEQPLGAMLRSGSRDHSPRDHSPRRDPRATARPRRRGRGVTLRRVVRQRARAPRVRPRHPRSAVASPRRGAPLPWTSAQTSSNNPRSAPRAAKLTYAPLSDPRRAPWAHPAPAGPRDRGTERGGVGVRSASGGRRPVRRTPTPCLSAS